MPSHRVPLLAGAAILLCALLLAGCADHGAGSQPPASTLALPPTPAGIPATVTPWNPPAPMPEPPAAPETGSVSQQGAVLQVAGPVTGFRGTGGSYIDRITFDLEKVPGFDPVDLEHVQVTLTRYGETTGLRFEITARTTADRDSILEDGETFAIAVPVMPNFWLYRNDRFELRVLIPGSAPILVQSRVPADLEEQAVLAGA